MEVSILGRLVRELAVVVMEVSILGRGGWLGRW
jgi:hypothetical protein